MGFAVVTEAVGYDLADKPKNLRVRSGRRYYAFECMVAILGEDQMARGWHYTKFFPSSALLLSFFFYLFIACALCYCSFIFCCCFCFVVLFLFSCSRCSFVDAPLIFSCPADHVPDWQPRLLLGMIEALFFFKHIIN